MKVEDPGLLNRLVLVKQLYAHAIEHGRSTATIDKIICITSLDHAVEMLLEGVVQTFPAPTRFSGPPNLYFADPDRLRSQPFQIERAGFFRLWDQVVAILQELPEPGQLILKSEMRSLHLARNEAQHSIKVPSTEFLVEMRSATRAFLDHLLSTAFDIALRQVSEALSVQAPPVRQLLEQANGVLAQGDRLMFAGLVRLAFTLAQAGAVQRVQIGRFVDVLPPTALMEAALSEVPPESGMATSLTMLQRYLVRLHAEVTSLSLELDLGLDRQDFSHFALLTPAVPLLEADGQVQWMESNQDLAWLADQLTAETCLWVQEYAIRTILRWEADGVAADDLPPVDLECATQALAALLNSA